MGSFVMFTLINVVVLIITYETTMGVKVSFVIGQISNHEMESLKNGYAIISKMILPADDYKLFRYKAGQKIQVETNDGNRLWCKIEHLETVTTEETTILIFTLVKD